MTNRRRGADPAPARQRLPHRPGDAGGPQTDIRRRLPITAQAARAAEADQRAQRRAGWARRHEATDIVEHLIAAEYGPGEAERREDEIADWLEESEDPAYLDLPMGEIVLAICRDLNLCIDWRRWAGAEWGLEAAAAEAAGKPGPKAAAAPAWLADFTGPPSGLAAGPPSSAVLASVPS